MEKEFGSLDFFVVDLEGVCLPFQHRLFLQSCTLEHGTLYAMLEFPLVSFPQLKILQLVF